MTSNRKIGFIFKAEGTAQMAADFNKVSGAVGHISSNAQAAKKSLASYSATTSHIGNAAKRLAMGTKSGADTTKMLSSDMNRAAASAKTYSNSLKASASAVTNLTKSSATASRSIKTVGNSMAMLAKRSQQTSFQTAQVAAQFQDIGVTAAMGMNPVMIAMQQGTQLAGQFQMSGKGLIGTLKGLVTGFASMFGPVTLFAIGLSGLTAYGIQCVDWSKALNSALLHLSSALDIITNNLDILLPAFSILTVVYLPKLITQLTTLSVLTVSKLLPPLKSLIILFATNPFAIFTAGITAASAALAKFTNFFGWLNDKIKAFTTIDIGENINNYITKPIQNASEALKNYATTQKTTTEEAEQDTKKILTLWEGISTGFNDWNRQAMNVGGSIKNYITGNLNKASDAVSNLIANLLAGTQKSFDSALTAVKNFGRSLISEMISIGTRLLASYAVRALMGLFSGGGSFLASGISGLISKGVSSVGSSIRSSYQVPAVSRVATGSTYVNITNNSSSPISAGSQFERYDQSGNKIINVVIENTTDEDSPLSKSYRFNRRG